ncbi:MAG: N-acyl homoserine lactonase family protein [Saprospiraceae bacterium]
MKIHCLQTGTVRCKQFQLTGASNTLSRLYQLIFTDKWGEWMPTYCWLIEHPDGLILVDTGETAQIYEKGYLPDGGLYHKAVETRIKPEEEIQHQLAKIGFSPKDVKTVIFTHLHGDHIGGLAHFEHCKIYVTKTEYDFAISKKGAGNGYFQKNWPSWFQPELITFETSTEGNFTQSKKITTDGKIVTVPTHGHSIGHQSIFVKGDDYTTILAGDLTYNEATLQQEIADVLLPNKAAKQTVKAMHQYVQNHPNLYLSSHDWNAPTILAEQRIYRE